ncbi:MAG: hypothetical protein WD404_10780 [Solirubrobacterales bacterium]
MKNLTKHLNPATAISCVALFVALSGAAYATSHAKKGSVKTFHLANGSVTTPKLRRGAVTTPKMRNGAVTTPKMRNLSVTTAKLRNGAVIGSKLANGSVLARTLANGAVGTPKLQNLAVAESKLGNGAVTNNKLGPDSVATGKVQDGAISATKLNPGLLTQLVKNVSYATKESPSDDDDSKTVTAECPAGKQVIGGGVRLLGAVSPIVLTESAPFVDVDGRRTGWIAGAREEVGWLEDWSVEAYAICAEF